MIDKFSLARVVQLVIFAVAVGISIKVFAIAWRHLWNIETGPWEIGLLVGSCVGLFIFLSGLGLGSRWAWVVGAVIIVGRFSVKLIEKYFEG